MMTALKVTRQTPNTKHQTPNDICISYKFSKLVLKKENDMKSKQWMILALALVCLVVFLVPSCTKKRISSEPTISAEEEARRRAEEEARRREEGLTEQDLKEGSLSEQMARERMETEKEIFENEDIYFEFDSVRLTPDAQAILSQKAKWLKENTRVRVIIEGHADNRGTNEYNLALGEGRAQSVKAYMVALGIDSNRMSTISYGEERPVDPAQTEEAWAKNRRAHFVVED
jgi:peptidoglycan-associated lipoprotein